jgi:hypothetical protein
VHSRIRPFQRIAQSIGNCLRIGHHGHQVQLTAT